MNQPYLHPAQQTAHDQTPKETLYVTNLNDKMKIEDLKFILYILFSQHGEIPQIVMKKTQKLRGQAFIVFQNITYATNAKAALQGMIIFDRPLQVEFANQRSVIFDRMEGKFYYQKKQPKELQPNLPSELIKQKKAKKFEEKFTTQEVNNVLLVEQLPSVVTSEMLEALFGQYPGYQKLSLVSARGIAFVEYDNDDQATVALKGLGGFQMSAEYSLQVKYAKKV